MPPTLAPAPTAVPRAWTRATAPVVRGPRPAGTLTLADLADPGTVVDLTAHRPDHSRQRRALVPVHLAVQVLAAAVMAPSALDGLVVDVRADGLGAVLGTTDDGGPQTDVVWVGDGVSLAPGAAGAAGAVLRALLDPVITTARGHGRIGRRTTDALAEDSLVLNGVPYHWLAPDALWLKALLHGAGYVSSRPARSVTVLPDAGPPVVLPARRVCCVLSARPDEDSCPTCPLVAADAQPALAAQWLAEVDDAGFEHLAGRPRVEGPRR